MVVSVCAASPEMLLTSWLKRDRDLWERRIVIDKAGQPSVRSVEGRAACQSPETNPGKARTRAGARPRGRLAAGQRLCNWTLA